MEGRKSERKIVTGLVVLLVIECVLLAAHLKWGDFRPPARHLNAVLAGQVEKNVRDLLRRPQDGLVWKPSRTNDLIYYYDSLLTLSQSTATLKLFKDTDLHLAENTLVTIEPPDNSDDSAIHIRFERGDFRARNPLSSAIVQAQSWTVKINSGSDVDFRKVGQSTFELTINQGLVHYSSGTAQDDAGKGQLLRINNDHAEKMALLPETQLGWIDPPPRRIYTYDGTADVDLKWSGQAGQLVRQTLGESEQLIPLSKNENEISLPLPLGHTRLSLDEDGGRSTALDLEVWQAPKIYLLAPLPRNRVKTNALTSFLWYWPPGVSGFKFQLTGKKLSIEQNLKRNSISIPMTSPDDAAWTVWGRDDDGFKIPPHYSYPLFIRDAPLNAPVLNAPRLREPASVHHRGASFWWKLENLILPEAQAEEVQYQIIFSWQRVPHADFYIIEISEKPDFRNPVVQKQVRHTHFTWNGMELRTYYWRVAGGKRDGRLGYFSEPQQVDLKAMLAKGQLTIIKIKKVKVVHQASPPPQKVVKPPKPIAKVAPAVAPPVLVFPAKPQCTIEWRSGWRSLSVTSPDRTKVNVQGSMANSAVVRFSHPYHQGQRLLSMELTYSPRVYAPTPASQYRLQKNLNWADLSAHVVAFRNTSHFGYGFFVRQTALLERSSPQSIKAAGEYLFGPSLETSWQWSRWRYTADYGAVAGGELGAAVSQQLRHPLLSNTLLWGVGLQGDFLFHHGGGTTSFSGQLSLAFQF